MSVEEATPTTERIPVQPPSSPGVFLAVIDIPVAATISFWARLPAWKLAGGAVAAGGVLLILWEVRKALRRVIATESALVQKHLRELPTDDYDRVRRCDRRPRGRSAACGLFQAHWSELLMPSLDRKLTGREPWIERSAAPAE